MKRLFLLRHAKAVPAESGIEDFDRTLMLSGMQDGGAMARSSLAFARMRLEKG